MILTLYRMTDPLVTEVDGSYPFQLHGDIPLLWVYQPHAELGVSHVVRNDFTRRNKPK